MSVFNALVTGVSGLTAQSQALATISDNIANVNTVGYKRVSTRFSTLVTQSNEQVHSPGGVRSNPFHSVDVQGLLQSTGGATDIGIEGKGFFIVNASSVPAAGDEYVYTRAGAFTPDNQGYLKNTAGYYLQGWPLDANGDIPTNSSSLTSVETINLSNVTGSPRATSEISLGLNLPPTDATGTIRTTQVTMYDTLGIGQNVTMNWRKNAAANTWELYFSGMTAPNAAAGYYSAATAPPGAAGFTASVLDGTAGNFLTVTFNTDGTLADMQIGGTSIINDTSGLVNMRFNFAGSGASATQNIGFNFGLASAETTTGFVNQLGQVGGDYSLNFVNQDGVAPGTYIGVNITSEGIVTALFDNGETRPIYKIPLADFPSTNSLQAKNGNTYSQTVNSGNLILREAQTSGAGRIAPNSLEFSTVDIAKEFSDMILTQRAYSANTKVISTADDMLEEMLRTVG